MSKCDVPDATLFNFPTYVMHAKHETHTRRHKYAQIKKRKILADFFYGLKRAKHCRRSSDDSSLAARQLEERKPLALLSVYCISSYRQNVPWSRNKCGIFLHSKKGRSEVVSSEPCRRARGMKTDTPPENLKGFRNHAASRGQASVLVTVTVLCFNHKFRSLLLTAFLRNWFQFIH